MIFNGVRRYRDPMGHTLCSQKKKATEVGQLKQIMKGVDYTVSSLSIVF
jgi:hypothetical protein